MMQLDREMP